MNGAKPVPDRKIKSAKIKKNDNNGQQPPFFVRLQKTPKFVQEAAM
jgi:hypothetical protein